MLFKILITLSFLSLAQAGCDLCEISSHITRRPAYMIDTTPRQTCAELYISLKMYGTESMCTEMIGKYQETCCGVEDPGQDLGPTPAPTMKRGEYSDCNICRNGAFPLKANQWMSARYVGTDTCKGFYYRGLSGNIPDFMCGPMQTKTDEICDCGIEDENDVAEDPVPAPTSPPTTLPTTSPTKAPIKAPTEAPVTVVEEEDPTTKAPTKAPTNAPSPSPTKAPTSFQCQDEDSFEVKNGKFKTCNWVASKTDKRCPKFETYCPVTCNACPTVEEEDPEIDVEDPVTEDPVTEPPVAEDPETLGCGQYTDKNSCKKSDLKCKWKNNVCKDKNRRLRVPFEVED